MSFWDSIGKVAKGIEGLGETAVGGVAMAFNLVSSVTEDVADGGDLIEAVKANYGDTNKVYDRGIQNLDTATGDSEAKGDARRNAVLAPIIWAGDNASRGLATAYLAGNASQAQGTGEFGALIHAEPWKAAWKTVNDGQDIWFGEAVIDSFNQPAGWQGNIIANPQAMANFQARRDTAAFRISSGAIDIAATWYADPTMGIAKIAKASRVGSRIEDAADADAVFTAVKAGTKPSAVGSVFGKGADVKAQRTQNTIRSTRNMDGVALVDHLGPTLERSSDAGPIIDLFAQAGKIVDGDIQDAVKVNVLLAANGSQLAREELITQAPHIARAMQRASTAPEDFARLDGMFATGSVPMFARGGSYTEAAEKMATVESRAELTAYGSVLDRLHARFEQLDEVASYGGNETVGRGALDRMKGASRRGVSEFIYQDSASGRTVNVLHWATGQRARGVIATDNTVIGQAELGDTLKRSKLFSGTETRALVNTYLSRTTQDMRNVMIKELHDDMLKRVAVQEGLTNPDDLARLSASLKSSFNAGREYSTKEMNKAIAEGRTRVTLDDPFGGQAVSVKTAVLETQLRNSVAMPDVDMLRNLIREHKLTKTTGDRLQAGVHDLGVGVTYSSDVWRLGALARPGYFFRSQLDTQARAVAMLGGTTYFHQAMTGLGHKISDKLTGPQVREVSARAEDLARAEGWLDDAASLERKADVLDGGSLMSNRPMADVAEGKARELAGQAESVQGKLDGLATRLAATKQRNANLVASGKVTPEAATKATAALGRRVASMEAQRATLEGTLGSVKRKQSEWARRAGEPTPVRDTPGERLRGRAEVLRESAGNVPTQTARANRLGSTDTTVKLDGATVKTRAYTNEQEMANTQSALYAGDESVSEALTGLQGKMTKKFYENPDDWKTVAGDDLAWQQAYVRATDALRNSYTTGKILREADHPTVDLIKSLRNDRKVQANWRELRRGNESFDIWLDHMVNLVDWQAPSAAIRKHLLDGKRMDDAAVDKFFKPRPVDGADVVDDVRLDRMDVAGPTMSKLDPNDKSGWLRKKAIYVISKMADKPDQMLGRHPLYVGRYARHFKGLAQREVDRVGFITPAAQAKIEKMAKHRAIKDVHKTMYDTSRNTGSMESMRAISPFLGAWQDAMTSWSRMMYDNPAVLGGMAKIWMAPEHLGLVVDEDGNRIRPSDGAKQKFITVPLPGFVTRYTGATVFNIRKDTLNSIIQGEVPWLPGFGPAVQVPAAQILGRAMPEIGDSSNPLIRSLFPFGTPKREGLLEDSTAAFLPTWAKRLVELNDPESNGFLNVYAGSINAQIIEAREAGKPQPRDAALDAQALRATRSSLIVRAMASGVLGISGDSGNIADFYRTQYNLMREQEGNLGGKTLDEAFAERFPEASNIRFRVTQNETGINATVEAENRAKTLRREIAGSPGVGWFYVGADNLGGDFSQSIYNAQVSNPLSSTNSGKQRRRFSTQELRDNAQASVGWGEYQKLRTRIDLILESRGLHSTSQSGAEDLADVKRRYTEGLMLRNPSWRLEFTTNNSDKVQSFIDEDAIPALTNPKMKDRNDIVVLGRYLAMRQKAIDILAEQGTSLKSTSPDSPAFQVKAMLTKYGAELARESPGFGQTWQRMLEREVD